MSLNTFLAELSGGRKPTWIGGYGHRTSNWSSVTVFREYYWQYDGSKWDYTNFNPNTTTTHASHSNVYINYEKPRLWNNVHFYHDNITGYRYLSKNMLINAFKNKFLILNRNFGIKFSIYFVFHKYYLRFCSVSFTYLCL